MSTPAKKPASKPAAKSTPASKPKAKPSTPAKKPAPKVAAKSLDLADLDSTPEVKEKLDLEILDVDTFEDTFVGEEDEDLDFSEDLEDEAFLGDEDSGKVDAEPTALIDRLSPEASAYSVTKEETPRSDKDKAETPRFEVKDSQQFELPPCLDTEDSTNNTSGINLIVEAYAPGCLDCSHLVPTGLNEYTDCHFSTGNTFCPAQSIKIVFTGRRNIFLKKLTDARKSCDSNRVLKILATLEKEPIELKNFVLKSTGII